MPFENNISSASSFPMYMSAFSYFFPSIVLELHYDKYPISGDGSDLFAKNFYHDWGFPEGSDSKESACNAGDSGSIPGLGRSPEEENSNPLQYSCLENPMDRGAWWATVRGITKSWMRLND